MATTGFWPVKGRLKDVINYAQNPDKTIERKYLDDDLAATLNYVENSDKTDQTMYVSGINCTKKRAYEQMMTTKQRYGKLGGNVAYHGYQSFQAGEVTPEEAHRIGIETAKRMWGDEYEIVVTTHLNTANLHNHIVVNSVSFRTGRKFENHISDHYKLREISDEVCREYGKSVIENAPFYGGDKAYWVRKSGRIPHKDMLRHDVDEALACTIKPFDFELYLRSLGYQFVRTFKYQHPSVIAPDWLKPVRLSSLGKDYSREAILRRLQSQREDKYFVDFYSYTPKSYYQRQPLIVRIRGFEKRTEPDVITALFDLIITIAKLITGNNVQKRDYRPVSPELRLEIKNLDRTLAEYHFLRDHNVECAEDFVSCRKEIAEQIKAYETERQHIRNRIRRAKTPEEDYSLKEQCREITKRLTPLRKQLIICGRIENKAPRLRALIEQEKQLEQGRYKYKYYHQNKIKTKELRKMTDISINKLHEFKGHPYQVLDNEEMNSLIESVQQQGIMTPLIVRPLEGTTDEYEIISGHRRFRAAQKAGLTEVPAFIRPVSRDEAAIMVVDSNLHREHLLPSEKAFAYKLKLEAISHQGKACGQLVHKSRDTISDSESGRQVQRYIRLTNLIPELLKLMDEGKIAFSVGVELSYLDEDLQHNLLDVIERDDCTPSYSQAFRMHKAVRDGLISPRLIENIMSEDKANQRETLKIPMDKVRKFAPKATDNQLEGFILKACDYYQRYLKRQRNRER